MILASMISQSEKENRSPKIIEQIKRKPLSEIGPKAARFFHSPACQSISQHHVKGSVLNWNVKVDVTNKAGIARARRLAWSTATKELQQHLEQAEPFRLRNRTQRTGKSPS
jgi:hypothetical protein